jgi:hypothetical protein
LFAGTYTIISFSGERFFTICIAGTMQQETGKGNRKGDVVELVEKKCYDKFK